MPRPTGGRILFRCGLQVVGLDAEQDELRRIEFLWMISGAHRDSKVAERRGPDGRSPRTKYLEARTPSDERHVFAVLSEQSPIQAAKPADTNNYDVHRPTSRAARTGRASLALHTSLIPHMAHVYANSNQLAISQSQKAHWCRAR